jgi:hypothetical protein
VAQLGQRLIDGAAKSLAEDFFKRFDAAMQAKYPQAYASEADTANTSSPAQVANSGSLIWWLAGAAVILLGVFLLR